MSGFGAKEDSPNMPISVSDYCSSFVGCDMQGDACVYVGVYDDEGNLLRYLEEAELERLLCTIDKATIEVFENLWSVASKAEMAPDGKRG